jgi:hypothetical protein
MITEELFLPFFQKNISIIIDNKTLRQGRLLLFSIKDFYLHFTLLNDKVTKTFELPYPFGTYMENLTSKILLLDYKLKTFTKGLPNIDEKTKTLFLKKEKHMKFFDSYVKIIETL